MEWQNSFKQMSAPVEKFEYVLYLIVNLESSDRGHFRVKVLKHQNIKKKKKKINLLWQHFENIQKFKMLM